MDIQEEKERREASQQQAAVCFVVMTSPLIRCSLSVVERGLAWALACECVGVCSPRFISAGEHLRLLHGCNYRPLARSDTWLLPVRATASGVKVSAEPRADLLGPQQTRPPVITTCVTFCLFAQPRPSSAKPQGTQQKKKCDRVKHFSKSLEVTRTFEMVR